MKAIYSALAVSLSATIAFSAEPTKIEQIHQLTEESIRFCSNPQQWGITLSGGVSGKGSLELSRLAQLVGDPKVQANINAAATYYTGVLQPQLAGALANSDTCRLKALSIFTNFVASAKSATNIPKHHRNKVDVKTEYKHTIPIKVADTPINNANSGRDTYQNNGTNNGIIGPVTIGRADFQLTASIVSQIVAATPPGKPVELMAVGSASAYQQGAALAQALQSAGFTVTYMTIAMLLPVPEKPITIAPQKDKTIIVFSPKS